MIYRNTDYQTLCLVGLLVVLSIALLGITYRGIDRAACLEPMAVSHKITQAGGSNG